MPTISYTDQFEIIRLCPNCGRSSRLTEYRLMVHRISNIPWYWTHRPCGSVDFITSLDDEDKS